MISAAQLLVAENINEDDGYTTNTGYFASNPASSPTVDPTRRGMWQAFQVSLNFLVSDVRP